MKFSKSVATVVLAAATVTAIFAGGCEKKADPAKPATPPAQAPEKK